MNRRTALRTLLGTSLGTSAIATLAGCQNPIPTRYLGRSGGDGKVLSRAVESALRASPDTNIEIVEVYSNDEGIVILKGYVSNDNGFYAIERVANSVEGVTRVDNATYVRD